MNGRRAVIFGAGGHAVSVAETVVASGYTIESFVDPSRGREELLGIPVVGEFSDSLASGAIVVLAIGDNASRERQWVKLRETIPLSRFPEIVHPTASVSSFAEVGPGTVIMQGAIVCSRARIGVGCLLNSSSVLEHECVLGDFASLAPGTVTGGRVTVGKRSALALGTVVKQGVNIGRDTVIGAASYVHTDIGSQVVAYGTPARVIRPRAADEPYLS